MGKPGKPTGVQKKKRMQCDISFKMHRHQPKLQDFGALHARGMLGTPDEQTTSHKQLASEAIGRFLQH